MSQNNSYYLYDPNIIKGILSGNKAKTLRDVLITVGKSAKGIKDELLTRLSMFLSTHEGK